MSNGPEEKRALADAINQIFAGLGPMTGGLISLGPREETAVDGDPPPGPPGLPTGPVNPVPIEGFTNRYWDEATQLVWTKAFDTGTGEVVWKPESAKELAGGAGGPTALDLIRAEAAAQEMEIRASQEQREVEMHPLEMQELGQGMELAEQQESRAALSDQFTRAQANFSAAFLADQLAASKREQAVSALSSMVEFMVPPGMEYWPGMEPGGPTAQILGQAGLNYTPTPLEPVAQVDFSQFTQGLSPETDAALRYLRQMQQQNMGMM